jgi:hypothetical protein
MIKKLIFTLFIFLVRETNAQDIVVIKTNFNDYCDANKNLYKAELKLNDTLIFKKIIDTAYFEFTIPKYLLTKEFLTVTVKRYSANEILGSICFPYISDCYNVYEEKKIQKDSLLNCKEYAFTLKENGRTAGCGSLPTILFSYNSNNLDSAFIVPNNYADKPINSLNANWDTYCMAETIKQYKLIEIIGSAGICEKDPMTISLKRAEKIRDFFISFGIPSSKIKVTGYGNNHPLVNENSLTKFDKKEKLVLDKKNARVIIRAVL